MLIIGQIVRYERALWRVDFVNDCRARIVPLTKRHVVLLDEEGGVKRAFDSEVRGVNISPNSALDIVEDVERAKDEIELAAVEEELREVKAALAQADRPAPLPGRLAPPPAPRTPTTGSGWRVTAKIPAPFRHGSLAAEVMARIKAEPGLDTKALVAVIKGSGNVAACVSRFHQAGLIEKS